MSMKTEVANLQNRDMGRNNELFKRIERLGDIKPDETVWTEERLHQTVRNYCYPRDDA